MYRRVSRLSASPNSTSNANQPPQISQSDGSPPTRSPRPFPLNQGISVVHSAYLNAWEEPPPYTSQAPPYTSDRTRSVSTGHQITRRNLPQYQTLSSSVTDLHPEDASTALPGTNQPDIQRHSTSDASRAVAEASQSAPTREVPSDTIPSIEGVQSSDGHTSGVMENVPSRPSEFRQTVYNTFILSLKLVEKLAGIFPVPGIKGAIGTLNVAIEQFDVRIAF